MIFFFDASRQMLLYPNPATGQPIGITIAELKAIKDDDGFQWNVDEAAMRKSLPRFGPPLVQPATAMPPGMRVRR